MTSKMGWGLSRIGALGTGVIPSFFMYTEDVLFQVVLLGKFPPTDITLKISTFFMNGKNMSF